MKNQRNTRFLWPTLTIALICGAVLALIQVHPVTAAACIVINATDSGPGTMRQCLLNAALDTQVVDPSTVDRPDTPPLNNYYLVAVPGNQYISNADDNVSGAGTECTLRDAIGIVNNGNTTGIVDGCQITPVGAPTDEVYVVRLPEGGFTYTLNGSPLDIDANTVHIVGAEPNNTILQASAAPVAANHRVLDIGDSTVELENVTIRHGRVIDGAGGGIRNDGDLMLNNCILTANQASAGGAVWNDNVLEVVGSHFFANQALAESGGAIYHNAWGDDTLTVSASAFYTNTALRGGAIAIEGRLSNTTLITGSTFAGNTAVVVNGMSGRGGGISNDRASISIVNSTFTGNRALHGAAGCNIGGGIENRSGRLVVNDSTFTGNVASFDLGNGCSSGGGLATVNSSTSVQGAVFANNTGRYGGAVGNWADDGESSALDILASTFTSNRADANGGAVRSATDDGTVTLMVAGSTFTGNRADGDGGALATFGAPSTALITASSFISNTTKPVCINGDCGGGDGGGIYNDRGPMTIITSVFVSNTAEATCDDLGCSGGNGGAIINRGVLTVTGTEFEQNTVAASSASGRWGGGHGGAIENEATLTVAQSQFINNTATGVEDGGGNGGAIDTMNFEPGGLSMLIVRTSVFAGNRALGRIGGAINSFGGDGGTSAVEVVNITISGNTSNGGGGGIANHGLLTVTNSTIVSNSAQWLGSGIVQWGFEISPVLSIHNSIIAQNQGDDCAEAGGSSLGHCLCG